MEATDIIEKKFDKSFNGYKMEEVDEFLQEMSTEFANLKKQNEELEKKMEVLADKIREYRNDEDAIKETLLGAQKQGNSILASAKEKSEKMLSDAKEKSEKMILEVENKVKERDEYAKKLVDDATAEKERILTECEQKAAEMKANMEAENRKQESILARTRDESNAFVERIGNIYKERLDEINKFYQEHLEKIKVIPQETQNDFVKSVQNTIEAPAEEKETAPADEKPAEQKKEAAKTENTKKEGAKSTEKKAEAKKEANSDAEAILEKTSEIELEPAFGEDKNKTDKKEAKTAKSETNSPFFDKTKHKSKYEKLEFGSNNKNK